MKEVTNMAIKANKELVQMVKKASPMRGIISTARNNRALAASSLVGLAGAGAYLGLRDRGEPSLVDRLKSTVNTSRDWMNDNPMATAGIGAAGGLGLAFLASRLLRNRNNRK